MSGPASINLQPAGGRPAGVAAQGARARRRQAWRRALWRHRLGVLGLLIVAVCVAAALLAPWLALPEPDRGRILDRMKPLLPLPGSSWEHPLGTDQLGRDTLARIVYGARISLVVGGASTLLGGLLGTLLGLLAGYYPGRVDSLIMRITDIQLSFPFLALAITLAGVLGPSVPNLIGVLAVSGWVLFARIVRAEVLSLRERDYVLAARSLGAYDGRILAHHILPNVAAPVIVIGTFTFAQMIIMEASLSFLGLGVPPPTPSWGQMLSDARGYMQIAWWLAVVPGLAIMLLVLGINLLGDWLRDVWDPRLRSIES